MLTLRTLAGPLIDLLAGRIAWERVQPDPRAFEDLCDNVIDLSRMFTRRRDELERNYLLEGRLLQAYLAYFFPVNLAKVQALLDELPNDSADGQPTTRPFRVLDVGGGPGTGALAALDWVRQKAVQKRALEAVVVDHAGPALKQAEALWRAYTGAAGIVNARLRCIRADVERPSWLASLPPSPYDVIIVANTLNELFLQSPDPTERRGKLIGMLLERLHPTGALIIMEPALRDVARNLHAVRDAVVAQRNCTVYSPCLHEDSCPALFKVEDWCHEERPWRPPPWIVAIDEVVGFIKDALKFSYVILRRDGRTIVPRDAAAFRVVSELRVMKGDIRAWLCSEQGRSDIGRLDRDRSDVNQGLDAWHRGAIVRLTNVEWKPERKTGLHTGRVRKTSGAEVIRPVDG